MSPDSSLLRTRCPVVSSQHIPHTVCPHPPTPSVFSAFSLKLHSMSGICFCSSLFLNDGEGNGNPLQYSCLERPVDRGAWWAAIHRVAQSRTRLKRLSMHACIGEGNGNPLQCSCLENPRDRGAWWAAVYGVVRSRTRLKRLNRIAAS